MAEHFYDTSAAVKHYCTEDSVIAKVVRLPRRHSQEPA